MGTVTIEIPWSVLYFCGGGLTGIILLVVVALVTGNRPGRRGS